MTYPGDGKSRPVGGGSRDVPNVETDASADCVACLGRNVPTFTRTYDNHPPIGPICEMCVMVAVSPLSTLGVGQCSGCYDTAPVRIVGQHGYCSYCVATLTDMAVAA